jgi:putative hemolysin
MLTQATEEGVFEPAEERIVTQVFRMADRKINTFLTQRTEITWLDIEDAWDINWEKILESSHSCFPVGEEILDNVLGLILAKDVLDQVLRSETVDIRRLITPAIFLPENLPAIEVIERLKNTQSHMALVIDEYGGIQGLVTMSDILKMMVEGLPGAESSGDDEITRRSDGSYLVDGKILIDQFVEVMGLSPVPEEHEGDYHTLGGFVMTTLGHIPTVGETLSWDHYSLEVVDMDGHRVDKLLVSPISIPD